MRSPIVKLVCLTLVVLALAGTALGLAGRLTTADLMRVEWILAVFAAIVGAASWRVIARRRERQRLESMRDSALW